MNVRAQAVLLVAMGLFGCSAAAPGSDGGADAASGSDSGQTCTQDASEGSMCGNGVCDVTETCLTCTRDCGCCGAVSP